MPQYFKYHYRRIQHVTLKLYFKYKQEVFLYWKYSKGILKPVKPCRTTKLNM